MSHPEELVQRATHALADGNPVGALEAVGHVTTPTALALRGIALAQLDEATEARTLLRKALSGLKREDDTLGQARVHAALAELAVEDRDLSETVNELPALADALRALGDKANACWLELTRVRTLALLGRLDEAATEVAALATRLSSTGRPELRCTLALASAEVALRRLDLAAAEEALDAAETLADAASHRPLQGAVRSRRDALATTLAVLSCENDDRELTAHDVRIERARRDVGPLVDAMTSSIVIDGEPCCDLSSRPALFQLLVVLTEAAPEACSWSELILALFEEDEPDDSHQTRLRVAVGRLRDALPEELKVTATGGGYRLDCAKPPRLLHPRGSLGDDVLLALLADGARWSASELAGVTGVGARQVQRLLGELHDQGLVRPLGAGRSRRWALAGASPGIATSLLLAGLLD
ncbi:MAG: helix-turn-helix domain-containing protein [Acidobacteriota bacterium]